jgi:hypothetical protein
MLLLGNDFGVSARVSARSDVGDDPDLGKDFVTRPQKKCRVTARIASQFSQSPPARDRR